MKNLFIILFIFSILSAIAQKKKTYFDKATTVEVTSGSDSIQAMLDDYERIQLPPLSVFLESVYDHPSIKIYEAKKDEANAEMKVTKREWLDYFRVYGQYQYGRLVQLSSHETVEYPEYSQVWVVINILIAQAYRCLSHLVTYLAVAKRYELGKLVSGN